MPNIEEKEFIEAMEGFEEWFNSLDVQNPTEETIKIAV